MRAYLLCSVLLVTAAAIEQPQPRALKPVAVKTDVPLAHVSAARELPDGRILVTNAKNATVLLIDGTGKAVPVGSAGGGTERYVTPGGLYAGPEGTTYLLDRGQTRLFTISPRGEMRGSRSIAKRGSSASSDEDVDLQRVDAAGLVYFAEQRRGSAGASETALIRFDAASQQAETIAQLRLSESKIVSREGNLVISRIVIGSPADGWGVAPDGRVALVRAQPYRVEWLAPGGRLTSGPVIEHVPLPMTDADKKRHAQRSAGGGVSVGRPGAAGSTDKPEPEMLFAPTKPPFEPDDVVVSPDARVWVMRTQPLDAPDVVYDVFDAAGKRTDRIRLPTGSRIVGFGKGSILVRFTIDSTRCELRKYKV